LEEAVETRQAVGCWKAVPALPSAVTGLRSERHACLLASERHACLLGSERHACVALDALLERHCSRGMSPQASCIWSFHFLGRPKERGVTHVGVREWWFKRFDAKTTLMQRHVSFI